MTPQPRWFSRSLFVLIVFAVLIRLFYWGYTGRTWEDALITVLHSENFVHGLGLTHAVPPGEPPLHGFTSPLSVLIPLMGDLVHAGFGLNFLKFISALCGGIAVWLGARICLNLGLSPVLALTTAAFLAFEHQQIMWGMAGMETEVATVAYLLSIYCMQRGTQWQKGLSLGFAMLARPDAAIWVAIAFTFEIWRAWKGGAWRRLLPVVYGLALLYLPWLIFTFAYYGSPVPNTILAKSMGYRSVASVLSGGSLLFKIMTVKGRFFSVLATLGPAYDGNGTGFLSFWDHREIASLMILLVLLGTIAAIRKRHVDALLVYAFVWAYSAYLTLCANLIFGWYTAPVVAAAIIGSFYGLDRILKPFWTQPIRERVFVVVGVLYIAAIVAILPYTIPSDKHIQEYIETGGREQVGLYLKSVLRPGETIGSESLGYVGYYSGGLVYDFPGLCSRRVVQYLRIHPQGRNLQSMLEALRPTYLNLRPTEFNDDAGHIRYPWIARDYELVRVFRVPDWQRQQILGSKTNVDLEFDVFRAKSATGTPAVPAAGPTSAPGSAR